MNICIHHQKLKTGDKSEYRFKEQCSLFGCNEGYIPWLLGKQLSKQTQGDGDLAPWPWWVRVQDAMDATEYKGHSLVIDLKPKQSDDNLSLCEVVDVWGYSDDVWTPALLHLSGLFVDADPASVDRNHFTIADADREGPIYEFIYIAGAIEDGKLAGRWTPPPASPTNAALLWPDALRYFFDCIRKRTPEVLGD